VVEDLIVVALLVAITSITNGEGVSLADTGWAAVKILLFVFASLAVGLWIIPRVINRVAQIGNNELIILIVLGLCFGLAIVADRLGFSMAIGAFLMGVIVAGSRSVQRVESLVAPIRNMFAAMFFVSMGALIDVTQFRAFLLPGLLITVLMIGGKMIGCGFGTRLFGYDRNTSFRVGLGMSQIGEFAFIVMKAGQDAGLTSSFLFPVIGVAAAITTFLTPYLIRLSYRIDVDKIMDRFKQGKTT